MRRSRQARRVINSFPPGLRLIVLVFLLIGAAFGLWSGESSPSSADKTVSPSASTETPDGLSGIVSVIDGDTLDLHSKRIRLHGIDAPESRQSCSRDGQNWRCGQQAALALSDHIGGRPLRCEQRDIDRYKRIVAVCYMGGEDVNAWLVRSGWAMAYRQYSKDYIAAETEARMAHAGVWVGEIQPPWEWRRKPKS
jgi:endonuclease YncB( thermonuclease family)